MEIEEINQQEAPEQKSKEEIVQDDFMEEEEEAQLLSNNDKNSTKSDYVDIDNEEELNRRQTRRNNEPLQQQKSTKPQKESKPRKRISINEKNISSDQALQILCDEAAQYTEQILKKFSEIKKKNQRQNIKQNNKSKNDDGQSSIEDSSDSDNDSKKKENQQTLLLQQPSLLKNGTLKEFQLEGLNWIISLYQMGINGILADEMGLGKTIQTISTIAYLLESGKKGPFMILCPLGVLSNWDREFQKWLPSCKLAILPGAREQREKVLSEQIITKKFNVVISSYEGFQLSLNTLRKFVWEYLVIDEGHKLKNEQSLIAQNLRTLNTKSRLILTGTPLQNNMHELWSLLNFLMPKMFNQSSVFDNFFASKTEGLDEAQIEEQNVKQINSLHKILRPFIMRRTKKEVEKAIPPKKEIYLYVSLSQVQIDLYKKILLKQGIADQSYYNNVLMHLRKCCNHPYLFDGVEDLSLPPLGDHIITNCGKMNVMDKLLNKLKNDTTQQHQVLIFTNFVTVLDILEDFCNLRQYRYCRIDGETPFEDRDRQIQEFTKKDSNIFIFMLSTRAGGLGINLNTADTVILYDSDFNPQADLQAIDRAHRIGQTKHVNVYRLISENTIEEKIIERQMIKLKFDKLLVSQGKNQSKIPTKLSKQEIKEIMQHGAREIFKAGQQGTVSDQDLEELLKRGQEKAQQQMSEIDQELNKKFGLTEEFNQKFGNLSDMNYNSIDVYSFENVNYKKQKEEDQQALKDALETIPIILTRTEDKLIQNVNNNVQNGQIQEKQEISPEKVQRLFAKKFPDFQLYPNRELLYDLFLKKKGYESIKQGITIVKNRNEQLKSTLTEMELIQYNSIVEMGFKNWSRKEYDLLLDACIQYGKSNLRELSLQVGTKTEKEIETYLKELSNFTTVLAQSYKKIRKIEELSNLSTEIQNLFIKAIGDAKAFEEVRQFRLKQKYSGNKLEVKMYLEEHYQFLIFNIAKYGYGEWEILKQRLRNEPRFKYDTFFKTRSQSDNERIIKFIYTALKQKLQQEEDEKKNQGEQQQQQQQKSNNKKKEEKKNLNKDDKSSENNEIDNQYQNGDNNDDEGSLKQEKQENQEKSEKSDQSEKKQKQENVDEDALKLQKKKSANQKQKQINGGENKKVQKKSEKQEQNQNVSKNQKLQNSFKQTQLEKFLISNSSKSLQNKEIESNGNQQSEKNNEKIQSNNIKSQEDLEQGDIIVKKVKQ